MRREFRGFYALDAAALVGESRQAGYQHIALKNAEAKGLSAERSGCAVQPSSGCKWAASATLLHKGIPLASIFYAANFMGFRHRTKYKEIPVLM